MKFLLQILFASVLFVSAYERASFGAACCGGGSSFPSLIVGDDQSQLGFSSSYANVVGDAPATGLPIFRSATDHETISTLTIDGAMLLSDLWQGGFALPVARRARSTSSASSSAFGLGDVSLTTGYEALPEWSYSEWKPRGFVFAQLSLPTGGNIYDSSDIYATDARGRGFYTLSAGFNLMKTWDLWDATFRGALSKSLPRTFQGADGSSTHVDPSFGLNAALGVGASPGRGDWRMGLTLNPSYEGSSNVASSMLIWNTSVDVSRVFDRAWALSLSYSDQTLMGPAWNVALNRTVALSMRYKWER